MSPKRRFDRIETPPSEDKKRRSPLFSFKRKIEFRGEKRDTLEKEKNSPLIPTQPMSKPLPSTDNRRAPTPKEMEFMIRNHPSHARKQWLSKEGKWFLGIIIFLIFLFALKKMT